MSVCIFLVGLAGRGIGEANMKKDRQKQERIQAALEASPSVRVALDDFVAKRPEIAQLLLTSGLHIQSLERIIERQEKRIEKLARENEQLKTGKK